MRVYISTHTLFVCRIDILVIVHKRLVAQACASRCWEMAGEIPVATMIRDGSTQSIYGLEDQLNGSLNPFRPKRLDYLRIDFLYTKRLVNLTHGVVHLLLGLLEFSKTLLIYLSNDMLQTTLLKKRNGCTEHTELLQTRHVDTIIVWIAYLRGRTHYYNLLRMQTVENTENALLERSTTDYAVVDNDKVVYTRLKTLVSYVVDM